MGHNSLLLRSPKKEEQEVPDSSSHHHHHHHHHEFSNTEEAYGHGQEEIDVMGQLEGFLGIDDQDEEEDLSSRDTMYGQVSWDFMNLDEHHHPHRHHHPSGDEDEGEYKINEDRSNFFFEDERQYYDHRQFIKRESTVGFWDDTGDDDQKRVLSLNLNLNYQEVLDAWSDRGPLLADDCSLYAAAGSGCYMGEVPVMEEERTRREASVMRYKEKRQTRLFSKKIRYQVRKLNADKRPRLKGRFVKRVSG